MSLEDKNRASKYDLISEYLGPDSSEGVDSISTSPGWVIAVIPLGKPLTYSRRKRGSFEAIAEGAFSRREKPLVIKDDCISLQISRSKKSHIKSLQAVLKHGETNYLSRDALLPGDWVFAWMLNNEDDTNRVAKVAAEGGTLNNFMDGLKFIGRVHDIRKNLTVDAAGKKDVKYSLTASGFEEMDTQIYYDYSLATSAVTAGQFGRSLAEIGIDLNDFINKYTRFIQEGTAIVRDNSGQIIDAFISVIVGKGIDDKATTALQETAKSVVKGELLKNFQDGTALDISNPRITADQKEVPYSYLVPEMAGTFLGLKSDEATKGEGRRVLGYADLLQRQLGVQKYSAGAKQEYLNFIPDVLHPLKGSFMPIGVTFLGKPLWNLLNEYLNDAINEMYMAIKPDIAGRLRPTIVARQIPFSTESVAETSEFQLTRFLELPRWVIHPAMIRNLSIGRSNATRINMVKVTGNAEDYIGKNDLTTGTLINPPIFDDVDIARSGVRGMIRQVNCFTTDGKSSAPKSWTTAIADWTIGSQYTLNGQVECIGIQAPIAEGDNVEIEGIVYHIESLTDHGMIDGSGVKRCVTTISISNGMPANQSDANADFPRYAGFSLREKAKSVTSSAVFTSQTNENIEMVDLQGPSSQLPAPDPFGDYEDYSSEENNHVAESLDPGVTMEGKD